MVVEAGHGTAAVLAASTWPVLPEDGLGKVRHCTRGKCVRTMNISKSFLKFNSWPEEREEKVKPLSNKIVSRA